MYAWGMDGEISTDTEAKKLVAAALAGQLADEQAEVLAGFGQGLLSLVLLAASKRIDDVLTPTFEMPTLAMATVELPENPWEM